MKKIFSRGNAAKQWILEQIDTSAAERNVDLVDFGCGAGSVWPEFLREHQNISYWGFDFNRKELEKAKRVMEGIPNAQVSVADAQTELVKDSSADIVTSFSALEHIVDLPAFLKRVAAALRPGGIAYLNYDAGHFRSHDVQERLMVPISQVLAKFGVEGPYMKEVDDARLCVFAKEAGLTVEGLRKNNVSGLECFYKKHASNDSAVRAWFEYEDALNASLRPEDLHKLCWSTTLVVKKP